ncbi:MAG: RNA 2',3'-cyclic phosphodiesterase [Candidatus Micrarchaeia archaeon]|jgi:2'-5' RNA ligase
MRLFAAIQVPSSLHPAISRAAEPLRDCMGVRLVAPGSWHLTLCFLGDCGEEKAKAAAEALAAVRFEPFGVRLSGAGAYPNVHFPRAVFIGGESPGAAALAEKVRAALSPLGAKDEKFSVHVTVARSKGAGDIDAFLKGAGEVGSFEAKSFVLMKSTLMAHEARHEVLREYIAKEHF